MRVVNIFLILCIEMNAEEKDSCKTKSIDEDYNVRKGSIDNIA
jgi:hypothetical protein